MGLHVLNWPTLKWYIHKPSYYYHHQIRIIHLSHCCHIFPWLCVWDGCTIIFCHLLQIYKYISGTLGLCFHYRCSVYDICIWSDELWPVGHVRLFADYTISLSLLCRLIWRHWTTKILVLYMLPSVCLRLRQFSQLSYIKYMGQLTQLSCDNRVECVLYLITIIKSEI